MAKGREQPHAGFRFCVLSRVHCSTIDLQLFLLEGMGRFAEYYPAPAPRRNRIVVTLFCHKPYEDRTFKS